MSDTDHPFDDRFDALYRGFLASIDPCFDATAVGAGFDREGDRRIRRAVEGHKGDVARLDVDQAFNVFKAALGNRILRRNFPGSEQPGQHDAGDAGTFAGAPAAVLLLRGFEIIDSPRYHRVPGFLRGLIRGPCADTGNG